MTNDEATRQPRSRRPAGRPMKRRHAAARSRVVAGILSVATFLGLGSSMAIRSAATSASAATTSASTSSTTSSRSRIPKRLWRRVHYGGFVVFAAGTAHGIAAGTDAGSAWFRVIVVGVSLTAAVLTALRVLQWGRRQPVAAVDASARAAARASVLSGLGSRRRRYGVKPGPAGASGVSGWSPPDSAPPGWPPSPASSRTKASSSSRIEAPSGV